MADHRYEQVVPLASEHGEHWQDDRGAFEDPPEYEEAPARLCCWRPFWVRASVRESPRFASAQMSGRQLSPGRPKSGAAASSTENECRGRFEFVRSTWFVAISGFVLLTNIVVILLELVYPEWSTTWWWFDQSFLVFYILELLCRQFHFQANLLLDCGTYDVFYNWLDFVLVVFSVYDQWVVPIVAEESQNQQPGGISTWLRALRVLRFLRALRLVRLLLEADTSWAEGPAFQSFIACFILANAILMGLETDYRWEGWFYFEQLILFVFFFELCVQVKHLGIGRYLVGDGFLWNWLDVIIVLGGVLDQWVFPLVDLLSKDVEGGNNVNLVSKFMMLMRLMRLLRILRLLRLVKTVRPLYTLAQGVLAAMQGMFWVLVLTSMTLYAFALLATKLLGHGLLFTMSEKENLVGEASLIDTVKGLFGTVAGSMFVLFQVMNGKEDILEPLFQLIPYMKVIFVIFMVVTSWALLSILTAVLSENMIMVTQRQDKEARQFEEKSKLAEKRARLEELFKELDKDGSNMLDDEEFYSLLDNRGEELQTLSRLSENEIYEVFEYLSVAGEVRPNDFVEGLLSLSLSNENQQPVSERSVMRLERRMKGLANDIAEIKDLLQFQAIQKVASMTEDQDSTPDGPSHVSLRKSFKEFRKSIMPDSQPQGGLRRAKSLGSLGKLRQSPESARDSEGKLPRDGDAGPKKLKKSRTLTAGSVTFSEELKPAADANLASVTYGTDPSKNHSEEKYAEQSSPSAQPSAMGQPEAISEPHASSYEQAGTQPSAAPVASLIDLEAAEPARTQPETRWAPCCGTQTPADVHRIDPA